MQKYAVVQKLEWEKRQKKSAMAKLHSDGGQKYWQLIYICWGKHRAVHGSRIVWVTVQRVVVALFGILAQHIKTYNIWNEKCMHKSEWMHNSPEITVLPTFRGVITKSTHTSW